MRLKSRIGAALRMLSLLLCGGFLLLGVRSCNTTDLITRTTEDRHYEVVTIPGNVRVTVASATTDPKPLAWDVNPQGDDVPIFGQRPIYRTWYYFGIGIKRDTRTWLAPGGGRKTTAYTILSMPFQLLAFIAFLPITWRILTIRHRRKLREVRLANSQCINCGYDIRATPERCPECGWKSRSAASAEAVR
jgi:hypothetical protein